MIEGLAEIEDAVNSVTDGYNDNGIDAIFFNKSEKKLWLVQSKFTQKANGGIDNGELEKFTKGIKKLINGEFENFNERVKNKQIEILEALDDPNVKIHLLLAYTGKKLSEHNNATIEDLLKEQNDIEELIFFHDFNIERVYKGIEQGVDNTPINEDFMISNWGYINEPLKAYYGIINGKDLADLWNKYGRRLLSKNIRNFLGSSAVNIEIKETIDKEPYNFIYFNNGITILCDNINKKPIGGNDKNIGAFSCEGISIVNGAQTFGSIGQFVDDENIDLSLIKVFVKFISLEESETGFGERITIATNTQNKVEKKDFVSLDIEQARIKTELKLENIEYHYKRTDEKIVPNDINFVFEEVAFSLASLWSNVDYSTYVKKQSGKLWDNVQDKPYTDLFNKDTSVTKIIKTVKIYRFISNHMRDLASNTKGRERSIYRYGNSFVAHIIFQTMEQKYLSDTFPTFDDFYTTKLPKMVNDVIEKLKDIIEKEYPDSMIVYVLRNFSKCRNIKELIIDKN